MLLYQLFISNRLDGNANIPRIVRIFVNLSPYMKKILQILILFFLVSILDSCRESPCDISEYSIRIYSPVYADGFKILGAEGMKSTIMSMSRPWQGAENEDRMLFIRRGGESVPEGFSGQVIDGDADRIVCMSSSHVAMLDAFSCADAVVGVSGLKYLFCDGIDKDRIVDMMRMLIMNLLWLQLLTWYCFMESMRNLHLRRNYRSSAYLSCMSVTILKSILWARQNGWSQLRKQRAEGMRLKRSSGRLPKGIML